jgi:hypothetical protein
MFSLSMIRLSDMIPCMEIACFAVVGMFIIRLFDMIPCNEIACFAVVGMFIIRTETETELPSAKLSLRFLQLRSDNAIDLHETWVTTDSY